MQSRNFGLVSAAFQFFHKKNSSSPPPMVGLKHLFTVFTQSWNIFKDICQDNQRLEISESWKSWTAPRGYLPPAPVLGWNHNSVNFEKLQFFCRCYNLQRCLPFQSRIDGDLLWGYFCAFALFWHIIASNSSNYLSSVEKQKLDVLGNSSFLTSPCLQQSGTVLPRGASKFSRDLRPQTGRYF